MRTSSCNSCLQSATIDSRATVAAHDTKQTAESGKRLEGSPPAALLAEALHKAGAQEAGLLNVHLADAAALVVRAQPPQVLAAALHLAARRLALGPNAVWGRAGAPDGVLQRMMHFCKEPPKLSFKELRGAMGNRTQGDLQCCA